MADPGQYEYNVLRSSNCVFAIPDHTGDQGVPGESGTFHLRAGPVKTRSIDALLKTGRAPVFIHNTGR